MKVNMLGLAGAVVGVVAILSTWLSPAPMTRNLLDILDDIAHDQLAYWSALAIILGTLVSFFTPAGSLAQIAGVYMWWSWGDDAPSEPGCYVALASAIILLVSMVRPLGPGLMKGPFSLKNRLLTFDPERPARGEPLKKGV